MAPPEDVPKFDVEVIQKILKAMKDGKNVLVHCRGGIGRAGLVACCIVTHLKGKHELKSGNKVVQYVRSKRDRRCVESRK